MLVQTTYGRLSFNVVLNETYLTISIVNFKSALFGGTWTINVKNNGPTPVTLEYNTKMRFLNDAKGWKNLNNVDKNIVLDGLQSRNVSIKENGFAGSIALSYVGNDNVRYISCADGLNKTLINLRFIM